MADREKTIKALTICSKTGWCENNTNCPYFDSEKESHFEDCKQMLKDALKLLKEQEPRVMALEEVKKHNNKDNCVWFELRDIVIIPVFVRQDRRETIIENPCILSDQTIPHLYLKNIDYCKKWRCWTSRPTDEQRKAVKWDD